MSLESGADIEDSDWERPVVFPVFQIPARLATRAAWGMVLSAALVVVASFVSAASYHAPGLPRGVVAPGIQVTRLSIGFGDRVSLFANGSGSLTVALLVVVAAVLIGMATVQSEFGSAVMRWRALLVATCCIGSVVFLADVARAIVILSNTAGDVTGDLYGNEASNIFALLPPALSVAGALTYAVSRLRNSPEAPGQT
ncbi:MAG TPA: hypothetical protein VFH56_00580 [Acidimicrobiales bacterium]|nr:hypothetical protein [Acidimicrobiales bacterium]